MNHRETIQRLIAACRGVEELAAITGKAASSRPDSNTDVLVLALWKIRAFIAAPAALQAMLGDAEQLDEYRQLVLFLRARYAHANAYAGNSEYMTGQADAFKAALDQYDKVMVNKWIKKAGD